MSNKNPPEKAQHFLMDKEIIKEEVKLANLSEKDKVLEIGAGKSNLTKELVKTPATVIAVESDEDLMPFLTRIDSKNLYLEYGNALNYEWKDFNKIVSNIPYNLSEQVINKAVEDRVSELVLVVGENFKNLLELKETKIGVIADLFFDISFIKKVPSSCFEPEPRVDSWLIHLKRREPKNNLEKLIREILTKNGKIKNAIMHSLMAQGKTKNQSRDLIATLGLDEIVLEKPIQSITYDVIKLLQEKLG